METAVIPTSGTSPGTPAGKPVRVRVRAFSHKVRTGCITCKIRHKKCDEEKPSCLRCRNDKFKCDGYAPPPPPKKAAATAKRKNKTALAQDTLIVKRESSSGLGFEPSPWACWSVLETRFYHHFTTLTCRDLAMPRHQDFWISRVLPLAHHNLPLRRSIAAVGAAHHFFTNSASLSCVEQKTLPELGLQLYNRAIASITNSDSLDVETVLVCCLLFMCFESMTGRYQETVKHMRAGLRLLLEPRTKQEGQSTDGMAQIYDLYSDIGIECSAFMEDQLAPTKEPPEWVVAPEGFECKVTPFKDLDEAAAATRILDLEFFTAISQCEGHEMISGITEFSFREECVNNPVLNTIIDRTRMWSGRFDLTAAALEGEPLSEEEARKLARLRMLQSSWAVVSQLHWDEDDGEAIDRACERWLVHIRAMTPDLGESKTPTFCLNGELVSSLSFLISIASGRDLQERAIALLESLNRREGPWDSREIAEMHRATLDQADSKRWYNLFIPGGIPGYVQALSSCSSRISPSNGLLRAGYDLPYSPGIDAA